MSEILDLNDICFFNLHALSLLFQGGHRVMTTKCQNTSFSYYLSNLGNYYSFHVSLFINYLVYI